MAAHRGVRRTGDEVTEPDAVAVDPEQESGTGAELDQAHRQVTDVAAGQVEQGRDVDRAVDLVGLGRAGRDRALQLGAVRHHGGAHVGPRVVSICQLTGRRPCEPGRRRHVRAAQHQVVQGSEEQDGPGLTRSGDQQHPGQVGVRAHGGGEVGVQREVGVVARELGEEPAHVVDGLAGPVHTLSHGSSLGARRLLARAPTRPNGFRFPGSGVSVKK